MVSIVSFKLHNKNYFKLYTYQQGHRVEFIFTHENYIPSHIVTESTDKCNWPGIPICYEKLRCILNSLVFKHSEFRYYPKQDLDELTSYLYDVKACGEVSPTAYPTP